MIEIRFKECCHICVHVKTDVHEEAIYRADGRVVERGVVVKCEHEAVCGEYQKYLRTEGKELQVEISVETLLNPYMEYLAVFATNHGVSLDEASRAPMVMARLDYYNKTGL